MEETKQAGPHPTRKELARFMRGELPRGEVRIVVRHMLTDCRRCVAVTREFWERGERAPGLEGVLEKMLAENGGAAGRTTSRV